MMANPAAAPGTAPAEGAVPDWFARGRVAKAVRATEQPAEEPRDERPAHPLRRVFFWLVGGSALGYAASVLIHLLLLVAFSWIALNYGKAGGVAVNTRLGVPGESGDEFLDTQSFELAGGAEVPEQQVPLVEPVPLETPTAELGIVAATEPELATGAVGTGEDAETASGSGSGDDAKFDLPAGGNAVSQGSFTAWTIPEDPKPGQDYVIAIEVTLPAGTEQYARRDLFGQLRGTDGYRVAIPDGREFNGAGWIPPRRSPVFRREGDKARIVFFIRGAAQALVRDTIVIGSRRLGEQQRLQITF